MITRIIRIAWRQLTSQPLRTFLILQGVIWGTAMGIMPSSVLRGTFDRVEEDATLMGTDRLFITQDSGAKAQMDWDLPSTLVDASKARAAAGLTLVHESDKPPLILTGATALQARGMELARGRMFDDEEVAEAQSVCVLEHFTAVELFGEDDPLGRSIPLVRGRRTTVIGITAPRPEETRLLDDLGHRKDHALSELMETFTRNMGYFEGAASEWLKSDRGIMIPHTLYPSVNPHWIEMRAAPRDVLKVRSAVRDLMTRQGFEPLIMTNAALPILYGNSLQMAAEFNNVVFFLTVLVGTAVVCTLMILSVVERQREIAIRRVEGARLWHIGLQFIVETGTLCGVGALAGVPLGLLLAYIRVELEPLATITWAFPPLEALTVVSAVTATGLISGLLPAIRAMRVDPVEILRYE